MFRFQNVLSFDLEMLHRFCKMLKQRSLGKQKRFLMITLVLKKQSQKKNVSKNSTFDKLLETRPK